MTLSAWHGKHLGPGRWPYGDKCYANRLSQFLQRLGPCAAEQEDRRTEKELLVNWDVQ